MKNIRETILRIIILLIGLTIAHFGVTLFLLADLGTDPFNVLVQGVFRITSDIAWWPLQTHGYTHVAMCLLIIVVLLFVDRSYIKIGTVMCMICGGPIIDFFTKLLTPLFLNVDSFYIRLIINGLGCVILAFGMTIVIKSEAGTGPNDLVAIVIAEKVKKNFGIIRVFVDILFVIVGFVLGGTVGIGTLVCAVLVGLVANVFLPFNGNWIGRIIKRIEEK